MRIGATSSDTTWEICTSLPKQLVKEFENGVHRSVVDESFSSGGETLHTLSSKPASHHSIKRPKLDISSERYTNL